MPRAVILTALPVEYSAVCTHLTDLREETHRQGTIYQRGKFIANNQAWEVGVAKVGAGNAGAAVETERAIAYFKPDIVFFVGIAGGIKDVAIGDVVAATDVYGYESGKVEERFSTRPKAEKSAYVLVKRAEQEADKTDWLQQLSHRPIPQPRVFVAPIAAGEKVLASRQSDLFQFLRASYNDAIAVEMEGFGFLSAAFAYPEIKAIVIRGISDLIEGKNDNDLEPEQVRQEKASHHASAFAFEILAKIQIEETGKPFIDASQTSESDETGEYSSKPALAKQPNCLKSIAIGGAVVGTGGVGIVAAQHLIATPCQPDEGEFAFYDVTVDRQGKITRKICRTAKLFVEDLDNLRKDFKQLEMVFIPVQKEEKQDKTIGLPYPRTLASFYMSRYPITNAQWKAVAISHPDPINEDVEFDTDPAEDDRPKENVSWEQANEFCARLSRISGNKEYRLPTETEWEYACRAGTTTPYHFGEGISTDVANYKDPADSDPHVKPVDWSFGNGGLGIANAFGLCDMHGNVWEWCADKWQEEKYKFGDLPPDDSICENNSDEDNKEKYACFRVLRGGAWFSPPSHCYSYERRWQTQVTPPSSGIGFRVVRTLPR